MSSESRIIRPFDAPSFDGIFADARLQLGDLECEPDSSVQLDDADGSIPSPARLVLAPEAGFVDFKRNLGNGAVASNLGPGLLSLLVTASTAYLKYTDPVAIRSLTDQHLPRVVDLSESRAVQSTTSGFTVRAYLVLNQSLPRRPLQPWRKGTWLAHTEFRVVTRDEISPFRFRRLDQESRERLGLRPKTMRYVHLAEHDVLQPFADSDRPELYLDSDLFDELNVHNSSPTGRALQAQLILDFMTAVIIAAGKTLDSAMSYADVEDSLTGRVVLMIAGPRSSREERDAVVRLIKDDPAKVIAWAEDSIDMHDLLIESLQSEII